MTERYFAKPMRGLTFSDLAEWLNAQGDSADTLTKKRIVYEGRPVVDVIELTEPQVEALKKSEHQPKIHVFRQGESGHVAAHHYFPVWR